MYHIDCIPLAGIGLVESKKEKFPCDERRAGEPVFEIRRSVSDRCPYIIHWYVNPMTYFIPEYF